MRVTEKVKKILDWYEGDNPGVKASLARIQCTRKLAGTGKVVILPVDQGFEHRPACSFAPNPPGYDHVDGLYDIVRGIRDGGGNGSINGRNTFQRPKEQTLEMLNKIIDICLGKA